MALNYTININGKLLQLDKVKVMGIMNITDDSFFAGSRCCSQEEIAERTRQLISDGADIIDIGACSTRPGAKAVSEKEESERLFDALNTIKTVAPEAIISVDTFRAGIARMVVEQFGVAIINDISAGAFDPEMFSTVAKLGVVYVLTHGCQKPDVVNTTTVIQNGSSHNDGTTANPVKKVASTNDIVELVMRFFAEKVQQLRDLGQKDIIIDPGFGFGKTLDENYRLLANISMLKLLNLPILVGVSRKSMIYKLLGTTPEHALNGTTAVHTICLLQQACNILRVHDILPARDAIAIMEKVQQYGL